MRQNADACRVAFEHLAGEGVDLVELHGKRE
jgi:hypothetical protein